MTTEERLEKMERELKETKAGLTAAKRRIRWICLAMLLFGLFVIKQSVNADNIISADCYSDRDIADYLHKRNMPEFQTERETKYRFITPAVIDKYVRRVNPRKNIGLGVSASTEERDAQRWQKEASPSEIATSYQSAGERIPQDIIDKLPAGSYSNQTYQKSEANDQTAERRAQEAQQRVKRLEREAQNREFQAQDAERSAREKLQRAEQQAQEAQQRVIRLEQEARNREREAQSAEWLAHQRINSP